MFGEKSLKLIHTEEAYTILEKDAQFEGKLSFSGQVQIHGRFSGEVFSGGSLIIGESGVVHADLDLDSVIIRGKFEGRIRAKNRIEIHSPAQVRGEIRSPSLVISEGAIFEGYCNMGQTAAVDASAREELGEEGLNPGALS